MKRSRHRRADGDNTGERLQKALASAGLGSRRECEELILDGRVEVDRQVTQELGVRVDVTRQEIRVDGVNLPMPKRVYFVVNKPKGVVSTNRDPSGRPRVIDLVGSDERIFPVGRLDRSSEGLILVTNDGELANLLTHPRYGIDKTYHVRVAGHPTVELLRKLREGVRLAEGLARVQSIRIKKRYRDSCDLEVVLNEGRNREIRRILARVGHKVMQLKRIGMGPLRLGELPRGAHRRLTMREVQQLRQAAKSAERGYRGSGQRGGATAPGTRRPPKPRGSARRAESRSTGKVLDYVETPRGGGTGQRTKKHKKTGS